MSNTAIAQVERELRTVRDRMDTAPGGPSDADDELVYELIRKLEMLKDEAGQCLVPGCRKPIQPCGCPWCHEHVDRENTGIHDECVQ